MKKLFFIALLIPFLLSFTDWQPRVGQYGSSDDYFEGYTIVADSFVVIQGDTLRPGELLHFSDTTELLVTQPLLDSLLAAKVDTSDYSDLDVLTKVKNVDGTGSGLDADLLDGQDGLYYLDNTDEQTLSIVGSDISISGGNSITIAPANAVNGYIGHLPVSTTEISVIYPEAMTNPNYPLNIRAYYELIDGNDTIQITNAVKNFTKKLTGFDFEVDTIAGFVDYEASDTTNLYPIELSTELVDRTELGDSTAVIKALINGLVVTESDPIVGAVTGAIKSDGSANFSQASSSDLSDGSSLWTTSNSGSTAYNWAANTMTATIYRGGTYLDHATSYIDLSNFISSPRIAFGFSSGSLFNIQEEIQSIWGGSGTVMQSIPSASTTAFVVEGWNSNGLHLGTGGSGSNDINFYTNRTYRGQIDGTTGYLLLGTTTDNGVDRLQVNGSVTSTGYKLNGTSLLLDHLKSGSVGTAGQVLTSNGAAAQPTWQAAAGGGTFSGARVYNNVEITGTGFQNIVFGAEYFDTDSYHSTSANTNLLTVPEDGYYEVLFEGTVYFSGNVPDVQIYLMHNGARVQTYIYDQDENWGSGDEMSITTSNIIFYCSAGDTFSVTVGGYTSYMKFTTSDYNRCAFQIKKL